MDLIDVDVLQFNNLIFSTTGDTVNTGNNGDDRIIGVAELLVVAYRCGGVQGY